MTYELRHHDLVVVPLRGRDDGIYWLRLYADAAGGHVAVITNVPGNPGLSATNGIEQVVEWVRSRFAIDSDLVVYEAWPRGWSSLRGSTWQRVDLSTGSPEWHEASRDETERLVGERLLDIPAHEELYDRVLALGGGRYEEDRRRVFEAYPLRDLPPPHNPSRCAHADRFRAIQAQVEREVSDRGEREDVAGRRFLDSLTPADLRRCPYHEADWRRVAEESVRIIEADLSADVAVYVDAARRSKLRPREREALASLFYDPILVFGGEGFNNGQHRGCALRFSGAERAAINTGDEVLGEVCIDWTYEGDG